MPLLTTGQFHATFGRSRRLAGVDDPAPFDFRPYFEAIPPADFQGHDCGKGAVEYVWRISPGPIEHVVIHSETCDVFMVLVVDREAGSVLGHTLLDLTREYGPDSR